MRRSIGRSLATASAVLVATSCSGGGGQTIDGTFTLLEPVMDAPGGPCSGEGGFSDIDSGLPVVVRDEDGSTIATTRLGAGQRVDFSAVLGPDDSSEPGEDASTEERLVEAIEDTDFSDLDISYCQFTFELEEVSEAEFYAIEVGDRGEQTYSLDEMNEMDWTVAFSLGSP